MLLPRFSTTLLIALLLCAHLPHALAQNVVMAFGEKIPPFCFPETNTGIEIDIIGEALALKGHTLIPKYFPLARVPVEFKVKRVDAAMTDLGAGEQGGFFADPAVIYNNAIITLKNRHFKIHSPEDLQLLKISSFAGADTRYPAWLNGVRQQGHYVEENNQALQVIGLNNGRYDAVLSDVSIFQYFTLQLQRSGTPLQEFEVHNVFTPNPLDYRPVFRSEKIRDDFNAGLQALKNSGRYQAIYDHYLQ
jgi:polar amino acid transport system substrate-binding protein